MFFLLLSVPACPFFFQFNSLTPSLPPSLPVFPPHFISISSFLNLLPTCLLPLILPLLFLPPTLLLLLCTQCAVNVTCSRHIRHKHWTDAAFFSLCVFAGRSQADPRWAQSQIWNRPQQRECDNVEAVFLNVLHLTCVSPTALKVTQRCNSGGLWSCNWHYIVILNSDQINIKYQQQNWPLFVINLHLSLQSVICWMINEAQMNYMEDFV